MKAVILAGGRGTRISEELTSVGISCVVVDTVIEDLAEDMLPDRLWGPGDNPNTSVAEYLGLHPEFEVDRSIEDRLLTTVAPGGCLKRVCR